MNHGKRKKADFIIKHLADCPDVIPTVARWIYDEWSFLFPGKTVEYIERLLGRRVHKRRLPLTLVAFKEDAPVGTVSLKKLDMQTRKDLSPWVASLFVVKPHRKKGIGAGLMMAVEKKAGELGFETVFLFTTEGLVRFYRKLGWQVQEIVDYHSYQVVIMQKSLRG